MTSALIAEDLLKTEPPAFILSRRENTSCIINHLEANEDILSSDLKSSTARNKSLLQLSRRNLPTKELNSLSSGDLKVKK